MSEPPHGGTVRLDPPPSADGFYTVRSLVKSIAEPAEGFSFERWKRFLVYLTARPGLFS